MSKLYVIWSEGAEQRVNVFEDTVEGRENCRLCIEFVEARDGAKLEAVVLGAEVHKDTI